MHLTYTIYDLDVSNVLKRKHGMYTPPLCNENTPEKALPLVLAFLRTNDRL